MLRFRVLDCQTRACLKELTAEKVEPLRVLDIGCGVGVTGERLKERRIKEVVRVELNKDAYGETQKHLNKVFLGGIEKIALPFGKGSFDCIIYGDRLEHLIDRWSVLERHSYFLEG